ncbi:hypothetical protein ACJX0J_011706, partial [Zea mays]
FAIDIAPFFSSMVGLEELVFGIIENTILPKIRDYFDSIGVSLWYWGKQAFMTSFPCHKSISYIFYRDRLFVKNLLSHIPHPTHTIFSQKIHIAFDIAKNNGLYF